MQKLVSGFLSKPDIDKIYQSLDQVIAVVKPVSTSLNDTQRIGLRTMAEGREGMVRTISRIALTHLDSLPRNEDPKEVEETLAYYDQLAALLQKVSFFHEMLDDTITAVGADVMAITDRYGGYLQAARVGNTSLDMALDQLDAYNKRFGTRTAKEEQAPEVPLS